MANEKILIIDDSAQIRDFLAKSVLPREGYVCVTASDGRAGLEMLGREKPDLILTDMQMPRMSGLELLQLLAQYKVDIPLVLMTAHGSEMIAIEAFRLGVKDYIVKPFTIDEVFKVIERALSETRLRREKEILTRNLAAANQQLERRVQEMAVLSRVGQAVSALLEPPVLMTRIVEAAVFITGAARGALLLPDEPSPALVLSATRGFPEGTDGTVVPAQSLVASVLQTGTPLVLAGARIDSEPYGREAPTPQAFLALPIMTQHRAIGALAVDRPQANRPFNDNDARLLSALADYAAISLQNVRNFDEAKSAQRKLEAVIAHSADSVVVLDLNWDVLLANQAAQTLLASELRPHYPLPSSSTSSALTPLLTQAGARGRPMTQELAGPRGKVLNASVSPVPDLGFVVILHDITMLKELDRIRRERELSETEKLRQTFQRYVSPSVVDQLLSMGTSRLSFPEAREAIVMVCDLRGFTPLFAQLSPEVLVHSVLNRFFSQLSDIVLRHGGTIDKFMGDGMLAIFGWPLADPDDASHALSSAVEMQKAFAELRADWHASLNIQLGLSIGIGQGMVVAGSIGSPQHQDYTVIGDAVSIALALCEQAHAGEIRISRSIADKLREPLDGVRFDEFPPITVKGKSGEHEIVLVKVDSASLRES